MGLGLVCLIRWAAGWDPVWKSGPLVTVGLVTFPMGFLIGLGGFDFWTRYSAGKETLPEDHSGHGARSWRDYFRLNTDHKVIGMQYLVTTIIFFLAGGFLALLFRAELARPGDQYFNPQTFNVLLSNHAALMIFLFVIPAFAGLGNFVIPLMIGAGDMAFPRLNALSYWLLPIAGTMLLLGMITPGGGPSAGWTCYAPLCSHQPMGQIFFNMAVQWAGASCDHDRAQLPGHDHHDARAGNDLLAACRCSSGRTSRPRCSSCSRRRSSPGRSSSSCSIA